MTLMLARSCAAILLFMVLTASDAHARLDKVEDFEVLEYTVALQPVFATKAVYGSETIRFKSLVDGLETISFSTSAAPVTPPGFNDLNRSVELMIIGDRRIFRLPHPMAAGEVATVSFSFHSSQKGVVFGNDTVYVDYFTCHVIVCDQDRPGDKAIVDLELDLPAGMQAVGPGRLVGHTEYKGQARWHWREERETSPYLLGFAAGKFERVRLPGRHPSLIVLSQGGEPRARVRQMFRDTRRMLKFFEQKSGVKYDERTYTQVLVDGDEAQEAARHAIIGKDEIEPILKDLHEDWVIAHELAHQWWGNSLTCADWSELWLNEGFAVFMTAAWKEHRWGRAAYDHELELANKRWQSAKDQGFDVPLSWQGEYPSLKLKRAMAYAKAVVFLDKLRRDLGEPTFWRAVKLYTQSHKNGVVTARDLQTAFETASGKDLAALFKEWVFGDKS